MKYWHSLYEILTFPIGVLIFAIFLLGASNLVTNPAFSYMIQIDNEYVSLLADSLLRIGQFIVVNFPLIFLIRLVTRRAGSATTIISAFAGYVAFVTFTMFFTRTDLPSTAYSTILGISAIGQSQTRYPIQTGIIATFFVALSTLSSYNASRRRSEYGFFSFINKDVYCVMRTALLSAIAGIIVALAWPYFIKGFSRVLTFISSDTTNPINLMLYGMLDRFMSVLNLGTLIRTPFWYNTSGGSWINMGGVSIAGDVNIWTEQFASSSLTGMTGRFITPYYVLNIFAMPGFLWGLYFLQTDRLERGRIRLYFVLVTIISMVTGCLLPLEITMLLLCPLLFFIHLAYTGILFGVFQAMHAYLGYQYTGTSTITALPGTLFELIQYAMNSVLTNDVIRVVVVGIITFVIYLLLTRLYFRHLAIDLFRTGDKDRAIQGTIEAVGGIDNVKLVHSSMNRLVISLFDPTKLDVQKLKDLGSVRIFETRAGYAISFGSSSTIIREGITKAMRDYVRISD